MLERLAGRFADRLLSKYFDIDDGSSGSGGNKTGSSSSSTRLAIWSGFVSYQNMKLKTDPINQKLAADGQPLRLVCGQIRGLQVTVPWSKLTAASPTSSSGRSSSSRKGKRSKAGLDNAEDDGVVIVVIDGLSILARMEYNEYDHSAIRRKETLKRRRQLQRATQQVCSDLKSTSTSSPETETSSSSWKDYFKNKLLQEGLLSSLAEKVEIHIRDLHVRVEDATSDPSHPFAFGFVWESMHIQHSQQTGESSFEKQSGRKQQQSVVASTHRLSDDASESDDETEHCSVPLIRKVSQLNHFGIYWNPLYHDDDEITEATSTSDLASASRGKSDPSKLKRKRPFHSSSSLSSQASSVEHCLLLAWSNHEDILKVLDRTIARRTTTKGMGTAPAHTYLLAPVDGTLHAALSPPQHQRRQAEDNPPLIRLVFDIPALTFQLRDVQCFQAWRLYESYDEQKYRKQYYKLHVRPSQSVHENARAWWRYAVTIVRYELRKRYRWSWRRFQQHYEQRKRYCDLYERYLLQYSASPDDAAGPSETTTSIQRGGSVPSSSSDDKTSLTEEELEELQLMDDGVVGHLAVQDIMLYRIVVHRRTGIPYTLDKDLSRIQRNGIVDTAASKAQHSWFRRSITSVSSDDVDESEQDYQQLVSYWNDWSDRGAPMDGNEDHGSIVALSVSLHVGKGEFSLFAPLESTADQIDPRRRLQQKFLDFTFTKFVVDFILMRDFDTMSARVTLLDYIASEYRSDQKSYTVARRTTKTTEGGASPSESGAQSGLFSDKSKRARSKDERSESILSLPVLDIFFTKTPPSMGDFHIGLQVQVRPLEVFLLPESEWMLRWKALLKPLPQIQKASKFWKELSMARINQWASSRLGIQAKARTALTEHKNIDLDIEIECPILRISDGNGSDFKFDLGTARLWTEKLSGVADSRMLTNAVGDTASSVRFHRSVSALNEDDVSVLTPVRVRSQKTRSRRVVGAALTSSVDSVNFANPVRLEEASKFDSASFVGTLTGLDYPVEVNESRMDLFFYDVFGLSFQTGTLTITTEQDGLQDVIHPLDIQFLIHKSVIPSDHTLCRFKVRCVVDEISLSFSEQSVAKFVGLLRTWKSVLSRSVKLAPPPDMLSERVTKSLVRIDRAVESDNESDDDGSSFVEEEFFDAAENDSHVSDNASGMMDEDWMVDSESVVDIETRSSLSKSGPRRKRAPSISDVSSISDASKTKGRSFRLADGSYLNAENLARLEEGTESIGEADSSGSDGGSFFSAVSFGQLATITRELEEDIRASEMRITGLRERFAQIRRGIVSEVEDSGLTPDEMKIALRRELDRAEVELKTLRAVHRDMIAQTQAADSNTLTGEDGEAAGRRASTLSIQRVAALLQERKSSASAGGIEHSMTQNLKRDVLQGSLVVHAVTVRLLPDKQDSRNAFVASMTESAIVLRKRAEETKFFGSVENFKGLMIENTWGQAREVPFFTGGVDYDLATGLLPSKLPHLISSNTTEEKLFRCALEVRKGSGGRKGSKLVKLRLVFGDVESSLKTSVLKNLLDVSSGINQAFSEEKRDGPRYLRRGNEPWEVAADLPGSPSDCKFYDVAVRLTSIRGLLCDGSKVVGALAVTEISSRVVRSSSKEVLQDRSHVDVRCGNVQLISIDDYDSGIGFEVFGKRELHVPLLRGRLRRQLMPQGSACTWVAGIRSNDVIEPQSTPTNWHMHAGIKAESFIIVLIPKVFETFSHALSSIQKLRDETELDAPSSMKRDDENTSGPKKGGRPTCWRLDFSLKKSFASVQDEADYPRDVLQTSESELRLRTTFGVSAVIQPSARNRHGVVISATMTDLGVLRWFGDSHVLESIAATLNSELPFNIDFLGGTENVPLVLPDDCVWSALLSRDLEDWNSVLDADAMNTDTVYSLRLSAVRMNLCPSACIAISNMISILKAIKRNNESDGARDRDEMDRHRTKTVKTFHAIATVDDLSISLYRESSSLALPTGQNHSALLLSINLDSLKGVVHRSLFRTSYSASIANVSILDFTGQSAVKTLSGGTELDEDTTDRRDFVSLNCDIRSTNHRTRPNLDFQLGPMKFMPLPSTVRSILAFQKEIGALKQKKTDVEDKGQSGGSEGGIFKNVRRIHSMSFRLRSDVLELVLSSKDIAKHVRDSSSAPIGIVAIRMQLNARGVCRIALLDSAQGLDDFIYQEEGLSAVKDALAKYLDICASSPCTGISSSLNMHVSNFQVLRTTIKLTGISPAFFDVPSSSAGERRITTPIDFSLVYKQAGFSYSVGDDTRMSLSHALRLETDFMDVLVYIAQSTEGMNEAIRVTVSPILEMMKKTPSKVSKTSARADHSPSIKEVIVSSPFVCSIRSKGIKVTFVPGGATRLTESPIVKFTLREISAAFAMSSVVKETILSGDWTALSEHKLDHLHTASERATRNAVLGGWVACKLSASYHNRRLVAWEPFVEPWRLEVHLGLDLTRCGKIAPLKESSASSWHRKHNTLEAPRRSSVDLVGGGRLRDIGRLLRSPFQTDKGGSNQDTVDLSNLLYSDTDFSYLALMGAAKRTLSLASYPLLASGRPPPPSLLPGDQPFHWLRYFGYPDNVSHDHGFSSDPAIMCKVSDAVTLNVNLTSALIEDVSDFVRNRHEGDARRLAPHRIRNESGLTLRFQEVLDTDRHLKGEKSTTVTLANDTEVPLSLKRALSQSCDPHMAYITVELGSFEDTIDRVRDSSLDTTKGTRSSVFSYKVTSKIPVDAVGLRRYPLEWNAARQGHPDTAFASGDDATVESPLGWIVVRVAIIGGTKVVTIESPLFLKNVSDVDLLCEIRDHDGLSLLWRSIIPRASVQGEGVRSVPADLVPVVHRMSYRFLAVALPRESSFTHESEISACTETFFTRLTPPRPYSRASFVKGLIGEKNEEMRQFFPHGVKRVFGEKVSLFLNVCSLRLGSFGLPKSEKSGDVPGVDDVEAPEQRMLLFRSPLSVANHLALPISVQVRLKLKPRSFAQVAAKWEWGNWEDLAYLACGESICWTGASPSEDIEIRIRFSDDEALFPSWSSATTIPAQASNDGMATTTDIPLQDLKLFDASGRPLVVSAAIRNNRMRGDAAHSQDNVKNFAEAMPSAGRAIGIYVPFLVVDGTGLDLQYKSATMIPGQIDISSGGGGTKAFTDKGRSLTSGLGELLDDHDLSYIPSRPPFEVFMIGKEASKRLFVRRRQSRLQALKGVSSPWSEPIPLTLRYNSHHDTTVLPPSWDLVVHEDKSDSQTELDPFALRSRIVRAPNSLGGNLGTKLVHIVCRYVVVNDLGRDVEITGGAAPTIVKADTRPVPFHFEDSGSIRFRPKEFGWMWSGRFHIKKTRREITLCVKHKLKGRTVMATVEVHSKQKAGTCVIALRPSYHAPYRVENRTIHAIYYRQVSALLDNRGISPGMAADSVVLPYHDAEFAWDDPEARRRSIAIHLVDFGDDQQSTSNLVGSVRIDRVAPGARIALRNPSFSAEILSDGPTRVLRLVESQKNENADLHDQFRKKEDEGTKDKMTWAVDLKLAHGIGVSVVDRTPQELLYIRLDDINAEKINDGLKGSFSMTVGSIVINNQLWVTPYPVLLRMGSRQPRRRHRRNSAVSLSWSRKVNSGPGYSDLTLFEKVELATVPPLLSVDGNLASFIICMVRQLKTVGTVNESRDRGRDQVIARDMALRRALGIGTVGLEGVNTDLNSAVTEDLYSAMDFMATSAMASKLRSRYLPPSQMVFASSAQTRSDYHYKDAALSKRSHKFYIERLRISTIAAEISWSGALPIASSLPRLLRPALTFEGLPLFIRPFSNSHMYGSTEDVAQTLRSHYVSIWRVADLLVGVLAKPTFLIRACVFTWRETFSTAFETVASGLRASEDVLHQLLPEANAGENRFSPGAALKVVLQPFVRLNASLLGITASIASRGSAFLHYNASANRSGSGLVRSRNPRLFAKLNGKDLLVEYVEGENAGRALLSRVRMGTHLGEGYVFHLEGARIQKSARPKHETDMDPARFIVMLTFERILLLNGQLNERFCDVVWEADFSNIVFVESQSALEHPFFVVVLIWFLEESQDPSYREERPLRAMTADNCGGMEALRSKHIFVPEVLVTSLLAKIMTVNPHLIDSAVPQ